jgi:hypothetical protein
MATAMHVARAGDEIKLEYGQPEVFALKFTTGKNVQGRFGPRVLFTAVDERKLWLDAEDGSDLERGMRDLDIQPAEFVRVTKIRHPRGGGHSIRVERVEDDPRDRQPPSRLEQDLERSLARFTPEAAPARTEAAPRYQEKTESGTHIQASQQTNGSPVLTAASAKMCSAMCAAVDAILETQAYATRRGLGLTFSEESVRAIGLSIYIGAQREGGR